jgi:hypothetical protein
MKLFEIAQSLDERKQLGTLYHFTSYKGMVSILNDGLKLENKFGEKDDKDNNYISFTRDKQMVSDTVSRQVRIAIDGTILSDRYQIRPYADSKSGYGRTTQDEKEERALVKKKDGFVDISGCVIRIDIKDIKEYTNDDENEFEFGMEPPSYSEYVKLINILPKTQIPYKIVNKY